MVTPAGLSSIALMKAVGVRAENTVIVDRDGVVYKGREHGMDQWKAAHATDTPLRTLAEATGAWADTFFASPWAAAAHPLADLGTPLVERSLA